MPLIQLETKIKADIKICFDLSRSIELHTYSTSETNEKAIAGVTSGLIGKDELVTWEATHLGFRQQLTSLISTFASPHVFTDEQVKGISGTMKHVHMFEEHGEYTIMKDWFYFRSPLGFLGAIIDFLFLKNYLKNFLIRRNALIKQYAESGNWGKLPGLRLRSDNV